MKKSEVILTLVALFFLSLLSIFYLTWLSEEKNSFLMEVEISGKVSIAEISKNFLPDVKKGDEITIFLSHERKIGVPNRHVLSVYPDKFRSRNLKLEKEFFSNQLGCVVKTTPLKGIVKKIYY